MGIRFPLKVVLDAQSNGLIGAQSVSGGIANTFTIPQDADNIVVKLVSSTVGGGVSTVLQTTDDGGTTWYDVARTSIVSDGNTPEWLSAPVATFGMRTGVIRPSVVATGSVVTLGSVMGTIGGTNASTLGQKEISGLPILSQLGRVFHRIDAAVTGVTSVRVKVMVNSEGQNN